MKERAACTLHLLPSGHTHEVPVGTTLFQAVMATGFPLASSCGADGVCAKCGVHILAGMEHLSPPCPLELRLLSRVDTSPSDLRMACLARIYGPVSLTTSYW